MRLAVFNLRVMMTLLLGLATWSATAQDPESLTLDIPLFALRGESLSVRGSEPGSVTIERDGERIELEFVSVNDVTINAGIPETIEPGSYQLTVSDQTGSLSGRHTLHVLASAPKSIYVQVVRTLENVAHPDPVQGQINVIILLTDGEAVQQHGEYPTLSISIDSSSRIKYPVAIRVGDFGFLFFDARADDTRSTGRLHQLRRELKSAQSTVGFSTSRFSEASFRSRMILLKDDPVQALVIPDAPKREPIAATLPILSWNKTPLTFTIGATGIAQD